MWQEVALGTWPYRFLHSRRVPSAHPPAPIPHGNAPWPGGEGQQPRALPPSAAPQVPTLASAPPWASPYCPDREQRAEGEGAGEGPRLATSAEGQGGEGVGVKEPLTCRVP